MTVNAAVNVTDRADKAGIAVLCVGQVN